MDGRLPAGVGLAGQYVEPRAELEDLVLDEYDVVDRERMEHRRRLRYPNERVRSRVAARVVAAKCDLGARRNRRYDPPS